MALLKLQRGGSRLSFAAVVCLSVVFSAAAQNDGSAKKPDDKKKAAAEQETKTPTSTPATRAAGTEQMRQLMELKRLSEQNGAAKAKQDPLAGEPKVPATQEAGKPPASQPAKKPAVKKKKRSSR